MGFDIAGVEAVGGDAIGLGEIDRALVLEPLADEQDRRRAENFLRAHHRVQGAQAREVADDAVGRDAALDERLFHFVRFVVVARAVVAGNDEGFDFAGVPDLAGGVDAVAEIEVFAAGHAVGWCQTPGRPWCAAAVRRR